MIPRIHKMRDAGQSRIKRLIQYVTSEKGKPGRVGDVFISNCGVSDIAFPDIVAIEMDATQRLNTRSRDDKTFHLTVSFPEGENPTAEQMKQIEERIAEALGYKDFQRFSVVHTDTDHRHLHMIVNKIHPTKGTILTPKNDHGIVAKVCAQLEKELSLTFDRHEPEKGHGESVIDSLEHKTGVETFASYVREHIPAILETAKDWREFHAALADKGITAKLQGNGLVFADAGGAGGVKGSTVGREYSKSKLEKRFGAFEPSAEREASAPSVEYKAEPKHYGKELYAEYRKFKEDAAKSRTERISGLNGERAKAIEDARRQAREKVDGEFLANLFRTNKMRQLLVRREERRLISEIRDEYEGKREAIRQSARQEYGEWMKECAAAGDERAARTLAATAERDEKQGAKKSRSGIFPETPKTEATPTKEKIYSGKSGEIVPEQAKTENETKTEATQDKKSLYDEYAGIRDEQAKKQAAERAARLEQLKAEEAKAIDAAKLEAGIAVDSRPLSFFRTQRLTRMLIRREEANAAAEVREAYKAKRMEVWREGRGGGVSYTDFLKAKARDGDARAIFALRKKGEAAPELLSISAKQLQYAKTVAAKIEGVTGRGTLFYKVGADIYRDNGTDISLRENPSYAAIKNGLMLAGIKYNAPLTLSGTEEFQRRCIDIARREKLDVAFADPKLEEARTAGRVKERTEISVAYEDREEARKAGMQWDGEAKKWYAPPGAEARDVERLRDKAKEREAEKQKEQQRDRERPEPPKRRGFER